VRGKTPKLMRPARRPMLFLSRRAWLKRRRTNPRIGTAMTPSVFSCVVRFRTLRVYAFGDNTISGITPIL
jgi:hypothetical protein